MAIRIHQFIWQIFTKHLLVEKTVLSYKEKTKKIRPYFQELASQESQKRKCSSKCLFVLPFASPGTHSFIYIVVRKCLFCIVRVLGAENVALPDEIKTLMSKKGDG